MVALTQDRNTPERAGDWFVYPLAAGATIHAGAIVALNAGEAVPGATATGRVTVGVAAQRASTADGDTHFTVRRGIFRFANSAGGDACALADVGALAYVVDDQTVMRTAAGKSAAGTIMDVDADGVWVRI